MKNLERELNNYYRSKRLSSHRIAAIQSSVSKTGRARRRIPPYLIPLAASILLIIGIGVWSYTTTHSTTHRVVSEIGQNHHQHGALMVESDRYGVVQTALGKLDFPIRPRREELVSDFVLAGGKYCTIQGLMAAQLKPRHSKSRIIHTLYVLPIADEIKDIEPGVYETDGIKVELWTDQSMLYGLAHSR